MHLEGVCYVGTNPDVGFPSRELRLITTCHLVLAHYTTVVWTRFIQAGHVDGAPFKGQFTALSLPYLMRVMTMDKSLYTKSYIFQLSLN
jgi:hypothetical protein